MVNIVFEKVFFIISPEIIYSLVALGFIFVIFLVFFFITTI